ncbi:MAG: hypothetical protein QW814_02865, partial [Methanothrix sp.]
MVEATKPNGNQNQAQVQQPNIGNVQKTVAVNVPKTTKTKSQLISNSKEIIKSLIYQNDQNSKNEFYELLKAIKSSEDIKEIKKIKKVVKNNFKRVYKNFKKEQPYDRII